MENKQQSQPLFGAMVHFEIPASEQSIRDKENQLTDYQFFFSLALILSITLFLVIL